MVCCDNTEKKHNERIVQVKLCYDCEHVNSFLKDLQYGDFIGIIAGSKHGYIVSYYTYK